MITENLTTLKINKLTKAQYEAALAAGTVSENELYMTEETNVDLTDLATKEELSTKSNKPTITAVSLLASNWDSSSKTYSLESTYPNASYDIEVALDSTATSEQVEAFNGAQIVGSATSNIIKAYGDVPTVDIPIILKVVTK